MKTYVAKSPTRVDLAGGTLDLWPLYNFVPKSLTINVAIDIFTQAELEIRDDQKVVIESLDQNFKKEFKDLKTFLETSDSDNQFFKVHCNYWLPKFGFHLRTKSHSPIGGGLGGSSSLSISVMKVFAQAHRRQLSLKEMVMTAHNLEAAILQTPTGIQDYVPAIQPGLNIIEFSPEGFEVKRFDFPHDIYDKHALLVYTGKPHHSGLNNFEVLKNAVAKNPTTMKALQGIRNVAADLKEVLVNKQWDALKRIFDFEYDCRIQLTPAFTSDEITNLRTIALQSGGLSLKICGAGGGGCVLVWCESGKKENVRKAVTEKGFKCLETKVVNG